MSTKIGIVKRKSVLFVDHYKLMNKSSNMMNNYLRQSMHMISIFSTKLLLNVKELILIANLSRKPIFSFLDWSMSSR